MLSLRSHADVTRQLRECYSSITIEKRWDITYDLLHTEPLNMSVRLTVLNAANEVALYNFLSTFSGTHFVTPRSHQLTVVDTSDDAKTLLQKRRVALPQFAIRALGSEWFPK